MKTKNNKKNSFKQDSSIDYEKLSVYLKAQWSWRTYFLIVILFIGYTAIIIDLEINIKDLILTFKR